MRYFILIVVLIFSLADLFAQKAKIYGHITTEGSPVPYASVVIKGTSYGQASDLKGYYMIEGIPKGSYEIMVSSIGYKPATKFITIEQAKHELNFELIPSLDQMGEVVVSGTMKEVSRLDSPVPVEVYTKDFFKANPAPSIFESLQNVNGVRPQLNCNVCNTGDIHINGLEGPYTMVLIDGMPIVSGLSTVYGLTGIPQSLIERVEIVKGPASTLYGSEAVGGLLNIITKKPSNAPKLAVDAFASDWGEVNTDIGLKYDIGKKISSLSGINYFNYQNPIDNNADGFTDLTLQNRISFFQKFSMSQAHNKAFSIAFRYIYEDRWGGEMNWEEQYRGGDQVYGESIYTNRWEAFGLYELPTKENISFQFSANGHQQNSVYGNSLFLADQTIFFNQLSWNKTIANHQFLVGTAYRYTYYDDNTPATYNANEEQNQASIIHLPSTFIQDEIKINPKNKVLLGVRYDYNNLHGHILSPRLNYKWNTLDKQNTIRLSIGNGYRVANVFTEDHAALTGAREVVFEGALKPETSWNANLNFVKKIYTDNLTFIGLDASVFYTYFTNRILPDYESNPNQIIYSNLAGFSVSKGISLNVDMSWKQGFKVLAGATIMDVSVEENGERRRQLLTESVQAVWSIGYTFHKAKLTLDYTGNLYGPMRLPLLGPLDDRPAYSPWWSIQNIQFTKSLGKRFEVYGGIKNLLNFTPAANSIARSHDPFDQEVVFDNEGQVVPTANNPNALSFDPSYVYAANQGIRSFLGFRYTIE